MNLRSINFNGGLEYSNTLDINPIGWTFENAYGVVLDYGSLPSDSSAHWIGGSIDTEGRTPIPGVYYRDGLDTKSIYWINGTGASPFTFTGPQVSRLDNSSKFMMIQSVSSSTSKFSAACRIPRGCIKGNSIMYIDFNVASYGAYLPGGFIAPNTGLATGRYDSRVLSTYTTADGSYRMYLANPPESYCSSMVVRIGFYDESDTLVNEITGGSIPLAPGTGWLNPTYAMYVPAETAHIRINFDAKIALATTPTSFLLDNVAIYPESNVMKSGSIETHVINFRGVSTQGPQIRSDSYIYGIRALYPGGVSPSNHRLSVNGTIVEHEPLTPDLKTKDRGFARVNRYVKAGDVLKLELVAGGSAVGTAYIDLSTI
jgi:hypothetical protein